MIYFKNVIRIINKYIKKWIALATLRKKSKTPRTWKKIKSINTYVR